MGRSLSRRIRALENRPIPPSAVVGAMARFHEAAELPASERLRWLVLAIFWTRVAADLSVGGHIDRARLPDAIGEMLKEYEKSNVLCPDRRVAHLVVDVARLIMQADDGLWQGATEPLSVDMTRYM